MPSNIIITTEDEANIATPVSGRKRMFFDSANNDHLTSKDSAGNFHDYEAEYANAGGNNGSVQFNNSGVLDGDDDLFWDDTNKRLGIGTNSPEHQFHIVNGSPSVALEDEGTDITQSDVIGAIEFIGGELTKDIIAEIRTTASEDWTDTSSPSQIEFYTTPSGSVTEALRLTIDDDGTVIVAGEISGVLADGVTATTQGSLDNSTNVATTAYVDSAISVEDLWDRTGTVLSPTTAGDSLAINTDTLYVDSANDRVGIGTVTPLYELHFEKTNSGSSDALFWNPNTTDGIMNITVAAGISHELGLVANSASIPFNGVSSGLVGFTSSYADIVFALDDAGTPTEKMRLTTDGYLGIGITPTVHLEVDGNAIVNGYLNLQDYLELGGAYLEFESGNENFYLSNSRVPSTIGTGNIAIGLDAFDSVNDANTNNNVVIGKNAGTAITAAGNPNVIIGNNALDAATSYGQGVIIGNAAGTAITSGFGNTILGNSALQSSTGASNRNTILGYSATNDATSGNNNTSIGANAGEGLTSGSDNIFIGYNAGYVGSISDFMNIGNTLYGDLTNGFVGIGVTDPDSLLEVAGSVNLHGLYIDVDTVTDNNILMMNVLPSDIGTGNTIFGIDSGVTNNTGANQNTIFGRSVAPSLPTQTADRNVLMGYNIFSGLTLGTNNNVVIGSQLPMASCQNASFNIVIGSESLTSVSTLTSAIMIGRQVATSSTNLEQSIIIGNSAATENTGALTSSILIGHNVSSPVSTTTNYLNIGDLIHADLSNGYLNIGTTVGKPSGTERLRVEGDALIDDTLTVGGTINQYWMGNIDNNLVISEDDLSNFTVDTSSNIILGTGTTCESLIEGTDNVIIGSSSFNVLTAGYSNIIIGSNSATSALLEDSNIIIGEGEGQPTGTNSYALNIGGLITGAIDTNRVRIGGTATDALLTSAALEIKSTTGALIVPRMTSTQRAALTPVNGMIIYSTTNNRFEFYENGSWVTK